jgi:DNA-binding NarL/FixJ family response regulator
VITARLGGAYVADGDELGAEEMSERALICDELALVRAGIGSILGARGVEIAAETRSGKELTSLVALERPELVVFGVPADLTVADLARRLAAARPLPALVALLPPGHEHEVAYLLALGVRGVGLRASETDELQSVIDASLKGVQHVVPALHHALAGAVKPPPLADREDALLSAREREVLVLLAQGRSNREIAAEMSVTLATVKSHLVHVYGKLGASNRNEALGRAVSLGLLA